MKRRSFLLGSASLAVSQLASSCSSRQQEHLKVLLLQDSIPVQLLNRFKQLHQRATLDFDVAKQLQDTFERLETWKQEGQNSNIQQQRLLDFLPFMGTRTTAPTNLVTLGDYWLVQAIEAELIEPLSLKQDSNWQHLPERLQKLVVINQEGATPNNQKNEVSEYVKLWGAPYRWGSTLIAYRRDKFKSENLDLPKDWSDLWNPSLRGRISMLDQSREFIGLTLKKLGFSYNHSDLSKVPGLETELQALHKQIKFYSSDNYLQPLLLGDTWVAVGWSTDIEPIVARDHRLEAVFPESGTVMWADLWVKPKSLAAESNSEDQLQQKSLTQEWINFCWQQEIATAITRLSHAASPILFKPKETEQLPKELQNDHLLLPDADKLNKSDFLKPLSNSSEYQDLWKKIITS
ncbi:MAG: extracellular solute-binding protein [Symploca sp. SIO1C4]|uniref:Extracellular solute-binding protein n=1 Tax=Symploca sp. SIO1C4 TaxID=2607765 RepID=A0A6B3N7I8_9CYAN|nr:extracellular solute-binding protein [Symploca sp. SIO1C4]NET06658.1 extracellular solute-binding protein [Symploca sp. SIO2B6]